MVQCLTRLTRNRRGMISNPVKAPLFTEAKHVNFPPPSPIRTHTRAHARTHTHIHAHTHAHTFLIIGWFHEKIRAWFK